MSGRIPGEEYQLVAAFAEREEQRQQDRADEKPLTHRNAGRDTACDGAQLKPHCNRQDIQNHDMLQHKGVQRQQHKIRQGGQAKASKSRKTIPLRRNASTAARRAQPAREDRSDRAGALDRGDGPALER